MSPRKSSTSSARSAAPRPRYLGLEVAGEHFPPLSPRWWEGVLRRPRDGETLVPFRLIRSEGPRAVVEVPHRSAAAARARWTGPIGEGLTLATVRTWGTLVGAKAWLSRRRPSRAR